MRKVYLYGALGDQFGREHELEIGSVAEAVQALRANYSGFASELRVGFYRVVVGKTEANGMELGEEDLPGFNLGKQDLHIVPVLIGSKRGGIGKIVAGIALIGLSTVTGGAAAMMATPLWTGATIGSVVGSIGTSLLLTGVATLLAPSVGDTGEEEKSFTSSGPQNSTREGGIVPIAYGEVICGGMMINGILTTTTGPKGKQTESAAKIYTDRVIGRLNR